MEPVTINSSQFASVEDAEVVQMSGETLPPVLHLFDSAYRHLKLPASVTFTARWRVPAGSGTHPLVVGCSHMTVLG